MINFGRKNLIIFLIVALVVLAGAGFALLKKGSEFGFKQEAKINVPQNDKLSILTFGDMMLDRVVYSKTQKSENFNFPFLNIDPFLKTGDLRIANLEGPMTDFKSVSNGTNRMRFTISPKFLDALKNRFEVLGLANNHMLDFGEDGYEQTKNYLSGAGINYFGDYKNRAENLSTIIEKNNIKIGFVGCHDLIDDGLDRAIAEVKNLKDKADFIIVVPHWGNEYQSTASARQQKEAREFIDAGADLILGSHPHVVQNFEEYKGKMIFYSLGNFIFDQYFSQETMEGLSVKILLEKSDNGISARYEQYRIKINQDSQPEMVGLID